MKDSLIEIITIILVALIIVVLAWTQLWKPKKTILPDVDFTPTYTPTYTDNWGKG